jgi:succinate-semialdehyde dehydrogenase/glutarate-semialdehyde dehydrogenase
MPWRYRLFVRSEELSVTTLDACPSRDHLLLVGGVWRPAEGGKTFAVLDPADGSVLAEVADASVSDARAALEAAVGAQAEWAASPPRRRSELLRDGFDALHDNIESLAELISLEMGKPLAEARGEVAYGAEFFRWFSEEAVRVYGRWMRSPTGPQHFVTMRKPVGPCYLITPWNFPLAMGARKIGPAIAAGCTMVLKPSELTPLTSLELARILVEVGLPDGVLNVVPTSSAAVQSAALMDDPRLRKVSFTGSTAVGRTLVAQSARHLQRVSMELGGNAPFLVFDDADLDAAVAGAMAAKMRNMGQACSAANRFIVHASVADEFTDRLAAQMGALRTGRGQRDDVQVGPLIEERAVAKVARLVEDAVAAGARVVVGGARPDSPGYFYPPTVLADVPSSAGVMTEEIFGPVAAVTTFDDESEAVARANGTEYGLASYVYTRDVTRAMRLASVLDFGLVGINNGLISDPAAPFGGMKASGFGREGGAEGIEEYLDTTYVNLPVA